MKAGIIVYSNTGHTLSVAQRLQERLISAGHSVDLAKIEADAPKPSSPQDVRLKTAPDIGGYDIVIFAAPVHGGALAPAMRVYLSQLVSLDGKRIGGFVTQTFPFACMGGTSAIRQMKGLCETKGGQMTETGIVNWSSRKREEKIADTIGRLAKV